MNIRQGADGRTGQGGPMTLNEQTDRDSICICRGIVGATVLKYGSGFLDSFDAGETVPVGAVYTAP